MFHSHPELYEAEKRADILREIEHDKLARRANKTRSSGHERKFRVNPFRGNLIKKFIQVTVSFLNLF